MFNFKMDLPILINETVKWKLIEGQTILLNSDEVVLLKLDAVATKIWLAIDGQRSGGKIADIIAFEFEVGKSRAEKDVNRLLKQLMKDGIIKFV